MTALLWIFSILLAVIFFMAGGMKLMKSREQLAQKMGWANQVPGGLIKLIGLLEVLAAIGLFLPLFTSLSPGFSIISAGGISFLMLLAAGLHFKRKEMQMLMMNVMLLALSLIVIYTNIPR